ncbi:nicotinamide riboside transporter PnuC [Psychrobium sp. 1_MG-2023]|uniref:nicotinamide riboside transporter PnuC n=1 Tax=Psychrobium sp. 1_MG-2023 TaxID=3062624 RepID=UPI000C321F01|nr:nicotinamide riboside transporter PnuC [Psychrobium sp. 1_MG-2023]MDP2560133.1 nicotinamide riboside transporter PnuC [Psychrobium sp. 1_MG-2023]PKF56946.1 nicotinamide mononucleotide transporter [Alteromonadales bacterium alter-6D02]
MEFIQAVLGDLQASSPWELVAVVLAIAYLLFAMRQSQWCWPAAFFSTMIYTVLFWQSALLMESVLNAYYLAMAVYGWWAWRGNAEAAEPRPIVSWSLLTHCKVVAVLSAITLSLGYVMDNYTHADFAYLDTATTVFAVFTTWMVTQKVLENWLYWIVINSASIYLYLEKSFNLTAGLFMLYCVMAVVGYLQWRKASQQLVKA